MVQRAPAHVGQRRDLDGLLLEQSLHLLEAHQVVQRVIQRAQVRVDLLRQVAGQESQAFAGFDGRTGQHQPLHRVALHGVDRAGHGQPGLAGAGGADAEGDVVFEDVVQVVALARRARTQVAALGAQGDAVAFVVQGGQRVRFLGLLFLQLFFLPAHADLDEAQLDVVDRQGTMHGLVVEAAQHAAGQLGQFAFNRDPAAAA
ncbi:hypothetical protein D3C85_1026970 [compost metagenome]